MKLNPAHFLIFSVRLLINEHTCRLSPFRCLMYEAESIFSVHLPINERLSPFGRLMHEAESCPLSHLFRASPTLLSKFCNGPCGNWALGLPHAERVRYHYTNHHQPTPVPDLLPLFGILLCPFRRAFGPQTELWCHGISFSSCVYSFRASPHKCPEQLNPAHFPFAHHFCASHKASLLVKNSNLFFLLQSWNGPCGGRTQDLPHAKRVRCH